MRTRICALSLLLCLASIGCKTKPQAQHSTNADGSPTRKEVLRALFAAHGTELSTGANCSNVGTEAKDRDIGDYLSGFLAEQDNADGGNWIEITTRPTHDQQDRRAWQAQVVIRHLQGEDRWGWGIAFQMNAADFALIPGSVQCIGAG